MKKTPAQKRAAKKWLQSPKGKASSQRRSNIFRNSERGKEYIKEYCASEKGKAARKKAKQKYDAKLKKLKEEAKDL